LGVFYTDANNGVAWASFDLGRGSRLWRTTDGGDTWYPQPLDFLATRIAPADENTWFASAGGFTISLWRTTDAGAHWSQVADGLPIVTALAFSDTKRGTFVAQFGEIFRTTDGGDTWRRQASGTGNHLMGISVIGDVETVVGWNGTILHTTTGGDTFTP